MKVELFSSSHVENRGPWANTNGIQASDADVVPGVPFEPADDKRVLVSVHIGERLHDAGEPSIRGNLDFEAIGLDDKEIPIEREPGP